MCFLDCWARMVACAIVVQHAVRLRWFLGRTVRWLTKARHGVRFSKVRVPVPPHHQTILPEPVPLCTTLTPHLTMLYRNLADPAPYPGKGVASEREGSVAPKREQRVAPKRGAST